MPTLAHYLFPLPVPHRSAWSIVRWWERRRPMYNLAVGGAGLITLLVVRVLGVGAVPWQPIVAYGILANVCYSLGPLIELAMRGLWRDEAPLAGPALFRQGLAFAVGLTLLPIIPATLLAVFNIYQWLRR